MFETKFNLNLSKDTSNFQLNFLNFFLQNLAFRIGLTPVNQMEFP